MGYQKWQLIIEGGKTRWFGPFSYPVARDAWAGSHFATIEASVERGTPKTVLGPCFVYPDDHADPVELDELTRAADGKSAIEVYEVGCRDFEAFVDQEGCVRFFVNLDVSPDGPVGTDEFLEASVGSALTDSLRRADSILVDFHDVWPIGPRTWPIRQRMTWVCDRLGLSCRFESETMVFHVGAADQSA